MHRKPDSKSEGAIRPKRRKEEDGGGGRGRIFISEFALQETDSFPPFSRADAPPKKITEFREASHQALAD